jgi:hypothetical protein
MRSFLETSFIQNILGIHVMATKAFYTDGGTIQPGKGVYLPRPADEELFQGCMAGEFCSVLTARQTGKSSLMVHTAGRLKNEGRRVVILDLTILGTEPAPEPWYLGLIDEIVKQLNLRQDYLAWWHTKSHIGCSQRFISFIREIVLEVDKSPLVIFMDEIDVTLSLSFSDDFFAAIRSCHNARAIDPVYERITFVLIGVATPSDLMHDPKRTPYNIGQRIDLADFTVEQVMPLADGFGLPTSQGRQILTLVWEWTGGHPYLTQRLCIVMKGSKKNRWTPPSVSKIVEETFFGEQSQKDSNIQYVRDMLTSRAPDIREVLRIYKQVLENKEVKNDERSLIIVQLKKSGIVREQNGRLIVRNRIYKHIFNMEWIRQSIPQPISKIYQRIFWIASFLLLTTLLFFLSYTIFISRHAENPVPTYTQSSQLAVYVDTAYTGTQYGTSSMPFNKLEEAITYAQQQPDGGYIYIKSTAGTWKFHKYIASLIPPDTGGGENITPTATPLAAGRSGTYYVNTAYTGLEVGSRTQPFNTIEEAIVAGQNNPYGAYIYIKQSDDTWVYFGFVASVVPPDTGGGENITPTATPLPTSLGGPVYFYVDISYTGPEVGSADQPFNTIEEAIAAAQTQLYGGYIFTRQSKNGWVFYEYVATTIPIDTGGGPTSTPTPTQIPSPVGTNSLPPSLLYFLLAVIVVFAMSIVWFFTRKLNRL